MDQLKQDFEWLHAHPELSYEEYNTTAYIRARLEEAGVEILPYGLETGLVAQVQGRAEGPVIALRADIDALPVTEESGLPYASCHAGRMHAVMTSTQRFCWMRPAVCRPGRIACPARCG